MLLCFCGASVLLDKKTHTKVVSVATETGAVAKVVTVAKVTVMDATL